MATFNSQNRGRAKRKVAILTALFVAAGITFAAETSKKIFAARVAAEFHRTQIQFQSEAPNATNAWEFARACYDFADFATNDPERAEIAQKGIAASKQLIACAPKSGPAHYYLGMNLGQLARTELIGALALVNEMEREFKVAAGLDKYFDYGGPERNLGLLYRDAPGWPASIGSRRKAADFLERAAKRAPDYPENILNLVESNLKWGETDRAKQELAVLDSLWPSAHTNFTGVKWEQSWDDWATRRDAAQKKLSENFTPARSPKNAN